MKLSKLSTIEKLCLIISATISVIIIFFLVMTLDQIKLDSELQESDVQLKLIEINNDKRNDERFKYKRLKREISYWTNEIEGNGDTERVKLMRGCLKINRFCEYVLRSENWEKYVPELVSKRLDLLIQCFKCLNEFKSLGYDTSVHKLEMENKNRLQSLSTSSNEPLRINIPLSSVDQNDLSPAPETTAATSTTAEEYYANLKESDKSPISARDVYDSKGTKADAFDDKMPGIDSNNQLQDYSYPLPNLPYSICFYNFPQPNTQTRNPNTEMSNHQVGYFNPNFSPKKYVCTYIEAPPYPTIVPFQQPESTTNPNYFRSNGNGNDDHRDDDDDDDENDVNVQSSWQGASINCTNGEVPCLDNSKCILKRNWCDRIIQCADKSDEDFCSCKDRIEKRKICDGYFDCPKGDDEIKCHGCKEDAFSCRDWSKDHPGKCIPLSEKCDGVENCANGLDETDCSILQLDINKLNDNHVTVGYSHGYLFRNWKGQWYPACKPVQQWALDACESELGSSFTEPPMIQVDSSPSNYKPAHYISSILVQLFERIHLLSNCPNTGVIVKCAPVPCGSVVEPKDASQSDDDDTLVASTYENTADNELIPDDYIFKIVGGRASQSLSWPFLVAIYRNGYFICGGTIINENWILTAAHVLEGNGESFYQIYAGLFRRFSYSPTIQIRQPQNIIVHPDFYEMTPKHDIALIKLDKPLVFNRFVRPICLTAPSPSNSTSKYCTAVGWGKTHENGVNPDQLRQVELPISPTCLDGFICAGYEEGGKDACQGDSGGPLFCPTDISKSQWYLAGVISHGNGCAHANELGKYTNVSLHSSWINETITAEPTPTGLSFLRTCPGFLCDDPYPKCLPSKKKCDKIVNCINGDDEYQCDYSKVSAKSNDTHTPEDSSIVEVQKQHSASPNSTLAASNGPKSQFRSSRPLPSVKEMPKTFVCSNITQTILSSQRCNKVVECEDGSDEMNCTCRDLLTNYDPSMICNGRIDCDDETDEDECKICRENEFLCTRSRNCIPLSKKCNNENDCVFKEDELDCYALSVGTEINLDLDDRPYLLDSGIVTVYDSDKTWKTDCIENNPNFTDLDLEFHSTRLCQYLGFRKNVGIQSVDVNHINLETNRNVTNFVGNYLDTENDDDDDDENIDNCTGINVQCERVLYGRMQDYQIYISEVNGNYPFTNAASPTFLFPWEAAIFVDGHYHCPGVLLNTKRVLTASKCTRDVDVKVNYTTVLVGLSQPYKYVDGPYQQILLSTGIEDVDNVDAIKLVAINEINETSRYIQPIFQEKKFYPAHDNDECVAIGIDDQLNSNMTLFKSEIKDCPVCRRCFTNLRNEKCNNNKNSANEQWSGYVLCRGIYGWYPAAIFDKKDLFCGFQTVQNLISIDYIYPYLMKIIDNSEYPDPPECDGIRCELGNCVPWESVCDKIDDCRDSFDESVESCEAKQNYCYLSTNKTNNCKCSKYELTCNNGECKPKETFCDGKKDCEDGSDEPALCHCANYLKLTHPERLCDNNRHCYDKSDEIDCPCSDDSFKCFKSSDTNGNVPCVSKDFVCDKDFDCANHEDEDGNVCRKISGLPTDPNGTGEVLVQSFGVWRSECFPSALTAADAANICKSMNYKNGSLMKPEEIRKYSNKTSVLHLDNFELISLSENSFVLMRDDEPLAKLVPPEEVCHRAFLICSS